ncbi:MAG: DNA-formamidopyrimidine glycosylase [Oceanospirillaceae bacterium]|uniref:bifunctional DNA-formamidopyrimidine glycosylase/DNA-(apurinic or apyrimidinic site) lyase n=1 Tax=unclassified Thalassolituus TaxID=2624967 RepID=UPI000C57042F|nr:MULTISPECIES: bifunctional DNA-formamidopyrimidine glycosylase/DNA-(apurinic or apyrimidinic site) lyase [unclassified Thalassolituus]MAY01039.1 DNA-formamidopyrimidine glycosylase [Oceanospirillaceae bacterium]MBL36535.1 DNA-formamidopyrimidine glycosylase [Oceanospirillaceae bacterium]MBS53397.1 DNA-formamidopyrimidine glycosylase [Oceanospirillaceae bacterium]|tara:strand:+ start:223 stop:1032 length:810 start_codon:yes stop_codon:yes gene_type:complete
MPELPEVETTKRGIAPWLTGQRIEKVIVRQPKLRWPVVAEIHQLEGQTITGLTRRAKYILVETAKGTAIWHLGMSGSLRLVEPQEDPGVHDHIDWQLSNGKVLRYHDPRRFGALLWVAPGEDCEHLTHLGPEPLSEAFTADYLWQCSRGKSQAIKTFIMDGKVVVGVGNIYANESLFKAGIRPQTAAGKISKAKYERLVSEIKTVLAAAIEQGGTTLRDFVGGDGKPGYFAQQLFVYGRGGKLCKVCDATLKEIRQGQRATVYCPKCQH